MLRQTTILAGFMVGLTMMLGCGTRDPLDRQAVSGTVSLDGQPLDQGTIEFVPEAGGSGILSGGLISGGEFAIPADKGLPPGTYTVRISSGDSNGANAGGSDVALPGDLQDVQPAAERIPARYNVQSELTAEIVAGHNNRLSFELHSN